MRLIFSDKNNFSLQNKGVFQNTPFENKMGFEYGIKKKDLSLKINSIAIFLTKMAMFIVKPMLATATVL